MKRKLTARRIAKLRKRACLMRQYTIRETAGLFGDFYGDNRMCLVMTDHPITARSPLEALRKYLHYYELKHKRRHENFKYDFEVTTYKWGRFMVKDIQTGYQTFYS